MKRRATPVKTMQRSESKTTINQDEALKKCSHNPQGVKEREIEEWEPEGRNRK